MHVTENRIIAFYDHKTIVLSILPRVNLIFFFRNMPTKFQLNNCLATFCQQKALKKHFFILFHSSAMFKTLDPF